MTEYPTLYTQRIILRPFILAHAPELQRLVGNWEVAKSTLNIPHPYEDGLAETWITAQVDRFRAGEGISFAITLVHSPTTLLGGIGLRFNQDHNHGVLGYWIGQPYWGQGYCTEAARSVLKYGFEVLNLHRIQAAHFKSNPASGRVMQKIGMIYEGCLRQHYQRWGKFEDGVMYGILRNELIVE